MPSQEQRAELENITLELLVRVGALQRCPLHPDQYFEGEEEPTRAYIIANAKIGAKEITLPQNISREKFMDIIKATHRRHWIYNECVECEIQNSK